MLENLFNNTKMNNSFTLIKKLYSVFLPKFCVLFLSFLVLKKICEISFIQINFPAHFDRFFFRPAVVIAFINVIRILVSKELSNKILLLVLFFLSLCIFIKLKNNTLLLYLSLCLVFYSVPAEKIIKAFVCIYSIMLITVISLYFFGIIQETYISYRGGEFIRKSYGFRHQNSLGALLFFLVLSFWTIKINSKYGVLTIIGLLVVFASQQIFIGCTTSKLLSAFSLIIVIFFTFVKNTFITNSKSYKFCFYVTLFSILFISFLCIIGSLLYTKQSIFFTFIDDLLTTRLSLSNRAISHYGFTFFGQFLTPTDLDPTGLNGVVTTDYAYIDSFYIYTLLNFGWCGLLVYVISTMYIIYRSFKFNYRIGVALAIFSIYGIMEQVYMNFAYNILLFLPFSVFKQDK